MFRAMLLAAVVGGGVYVASGVNWKHVAYVWNTGGTSHTITSFMRSVGGMVTADTGVRQSGVRLPHPEF